MKFNDDAWFSNAYNATVSGVNKTELLYLEVNFLKLIDFQLMVDPQTFKNYYNHLVEVSGWAAVLSNCSWHDPAHSYMLYNNMIKKRNDNRMESSSGHGKEFESTKSSKHFSQSSEKSVSTQDSHSKKNSSSHSSLKHLRRDSFIDKNEIMEEELKIASNQVNMGWQASFNPEYKENFKESHHDESFQSSHACYDSSSFVGKSFSNGSAKCKPQFDSFIVDNKYPTCKHEKHSKSGVDHFEHHRISY